MQKVRNRAKRGRLASAIATQERDDGTLRHLKRHALEDQDHVVINDLDAIDVQDDVVVGGCCAHACNFLKSQNRSRLCDLRACLKAGPAVFPAATAERALPGHWWRPLRAAEGEGALAP